MRGFWRLSWECASAKINYAFVKALGRGERPLIPCCLGTFTAITRVFAVTAPGWSSTTTRDVHITGFFTDFYQEPKELVQQGKSKK